MKDPPVPTGVSRLSADASPSPVRAAPRAGVTWSRMSLRSVPDARQPVPLVWWVPVVAVVVLATTTLAILPISGGIGWPIAALVVSIIGYSVVWLAIRPGRLRLSPPVVTSVGADSTDYLAPVTRPIPIVALTRPPRFRTGTLLVRSAAVAVGASAVWALLFALWLRPRVPMIPIRLTGPEAVVGALIDSLVTSILEECGMAILVLAVAGLAARFLPPHFDTRSVGYLAIAAATLARTLLHLPLWGVGAFGRIALAFVLGWLFWRTRRIWPLIVVHVLWDMLALQTLLSPTMTVRNLAALMVLGWTITGLVITWVTLAHSRTDLRREHARQASRGPTGRPAAGRLSQ